MQDPSRTYLFRIRGWIGLEGISSRYQYSSGEYAFLEDCRRAAVSFKDAPPPGFRGRLEPRWVYAVTRKDDKTVLSLVDEVQQGAWW